jgi:predicted dehydrogenase
MHSVSHAVDTALYLLGHPPVGYVQASLSGAAYDPRTNRWDADPTVSGAFIQFQDGTSAHLCTNGARWYTFDLFGTTGMASAYDNNARYRLRRRSDGWFGSEDVPFPPFEDESDTLVAIRELGDAISRGAPQDTSGNAESAWQGMEVLCAMAESHLRAGARVTLPLQNRAMYIPSR